MQFGPAISRTSAIGQIVLTDMDTFAATTRAIFRVIVDNQAEPRAAVGGVSFTASDVLDLSRRACLCPQLDEIDAAGDHLLGDRFRAPSSDVAEIENAVEPATI